MILLTWNCTDQNTSIGGQGKGRVIHRVEEQEGVEMTCLRSSESGMMTLA